MKSNTSCNDCFHVGLHVACCMLHEVAWGCMMRQLFSSKCQKHNGCGATIIGRAGKEIIKDYSVLDFEPRLNTSSYVWNSRGG